MLFSVFSRQWQVEENIEWQLSQQKTVDGIIRCHLLPVFGDTHHRCHQKNGCLQFRLNLNEAGLSPSRINHIMTSVQMFIHEAAERFDYESPWRIHAGLFFINITNQRYHSLLITIIDVKFALSH
jgi:hypothetical protein